MLFRALSIAALIGLIGSSSAFAGGPGRGSVAQVRVPTMSAASRLSSNVIKKDTQTTQQIIDKIARSPGGTAVVRGAMARTGNGDGCPRWTCTSNGTKLTGLVQETVEATEAIVTGVMLPSGDIIDLR